MNTNTAIVTKAVRKRTRIIEQGRRDGLLDRNTADAAHALLYVNAQLAYIVKHKDYIPINEVELLIAMGSNEFTVGDMLLDVTRLLEIIYPLLQKRAEGVYGSYQEVIESILSNGSIERVFLDRFSIGGNEELTKRQLAIYASFERDARRICQQIVADKDKRLLPIFYSDEERRNTFFLLFGGYARACPKHRKTYN